MARSPSKSAKPVHTPGVSDMSGTFVHDAPKTRGKDPMFAPITGPRLTPEEAPSVDAEPDEPFDVWIARAADILRAVFAVRPVAADPLTASLPILATGDGDASARAAAACGLSERQHRRLFHRLHGVPPKGYQRLLRVDRMIRRLHDTPWEADAWAEAPIPFADQPHAIREFRALTGLTPRAYVRAKRSGDATLRSVSGDPSAPPPP